MKKYVLLSIGILVLSGFASTPPILGATRTLEITKSNLLDKTEFSLSFSLRGARVIIRRINDDDTIRHLLEHC